MSNPNLKFGRRAPQNAPAITFSSIFKGALPAFPPSYDSIEGWTGWEMLGNDRIGDCVAVSFATERRILSNKAEYPTLAQVIEFYQTQNPDFDPNGTAETNGPGSQYDRGMSIQTAIETLVNQGGPDGVKAVAFARVDHTNLDEIKAALAFFRTVWLGVNVTGDNQSEFPSRVWTPTGQVEGGHSIILTGYDPEKLKMETWAAEAFLSNDYMTSPTADQGGPGVEEAWVVIWPEHLANLTADQIEALKAEYLAITGKELVIPDPTPTPDPEPTPKPSPKPSPSEVDKIEADFKKFIKKIEAQFRKFLKDHQVG